MTVGKRIKKLRMEKGLSQKELAEQMNVAFQTVSKWEKDENEPDISTLKVLAKIFSCSVDFLINEDDETEQEEEKSKEEKKKKVKYREVYKSGIKFDCEAHAELDNGYVPGRKKLTGKWFRENMMNHRNLMNQRGYTRKFCIMDDLVLDFFVDEKNKAVGFFFDGAEQFVCPFENIISHQITSDGAPIVPFVSKSVFGTTVSNSGVGIVSGSYNRPVDAKLPFIKLSITYYVNSEETDTFEIQFTVLRKYRITNGEEHYFEKNNMLVDKTLSRLKTVELELKTAIEIGNRIKNKEIDVEEIDYSPMRQAYAPGQQYRKKIEESYKALAVKEKRDREIGGALGGLAILIVIGVAIWLFIYFVFK